MNQPTNKRPPKLLYNYDRAPGEPSHREVPALEPVEYAAIPPTMPSTGKTSLFSKRTRQQSRGDEE